MAKDQTEVGITGLPIPKKKRSPKKQYEFEKKRRENLGTNVGGQTYKKDVTPYYKRTFEEFMSICEGKKSDIPPHAVPGTYQKDSDGTQRYTLQRYEGPLSKPTKKEINQLVVKRSGAKAVEQRLKRLSKSKDT